MSAGKVTGQKAIDERHHCGDKIETGLKTNVVSRIAGLVNKICPLVESISKQTGFNLLLNHE